MERRVGGEEGVLIKCLTGTVLSVHQLRFTTIRLSLSSDRCLCAHRVHFSSHSAALFAEEPVKVGPTAVQTLMTPRCVCWRPLHHSSWFFSLLLSGVSTAFTMAPRKKRGSRWREIKERSRGGTRGEENEWINNMRDVAKEQRSQRGQQQHHKSKLLFILVCCAIMVF